MVDLLLGHEISLHYLVFSAFDPVLRPRASNLADHIVENDGKSARHDDLFRLGPGRSGCPQGFESGRCREDRLSMSCLGEDNPQDRTSAESSVGIDGNPDLVPSVDGGEEALNGEVVLADVGCDERQFLK